MPTTKGKSLNTYKPPSTHTGFTDPTCNAPIYEIHVRGYLDKTYSEWLDGLEVNLLENGETLLTGPIIDQSALMGIFNKLARLSLTIISFHEVKTITHKEKK